MGFGMYVITRLPARLINLATEPGFKEVVDVILDTVKQYPKSYQERRMQWALASEWRGQCLWAQEYVDAIKSGILSVLRRKFLRPRKTPAMIAAWEAWGNNPEDQAILAQQRAQWSAWHNISVDESILDKYRPQWDAIYTALDPPSK
jgi:hypothetical protein